VQNASTLLKKSALLIICCGALILIVMDNGDKYYDFPHPIRRDRVSSDPALKQGMNLFMIHELVLLSQKLLALE
jgi:hypothetical protein